MRPNSAQRCSVGTALPGLSSFSTPTPCSPVRRRRPPRTAQDVGAELLCLLQLAGLVGVEQDQRVQIAVAGMEHVGDAQAVLLRQLGHAAQHIGQPRRGIVPSMQ
jgi:hypothetical protein